MDFNKYDMFAYQVIDYLVTKHEYQVIRVQQHKEDIWLMNAQQTKYPVIRISSKSNDSTLADSEYIRNAHRSILDLIQREGPIMIFNTNPECTPIENTFLTQIKVTPNGVSDESILSTFHELDSIVHESDDYEKEIVSITKEIEEVQHKRQVKFYEKLQARTRPKTTYVVMAICVLLSLASYAFSFYIQDEMSTLVAFGAFYKMNIVAAYEYFRLLSAGFLHQDPIILAINMFVLYSIGKACEHCFKRWQFISILLLSIVVGNLFLLVAEANALALGMGDGVFGLLGAYFIVLVLKGTMKHPFVKLSFLRLAIFGSILILLPGLSYHAYLGGFVCGVVLGILYSNSEKIAQLKKHVMSASLILLVGVTYLGMKTTTIEPLDKEFDASIVNIYRNTALNKYADYLQKCYNKQYRME
ncbi:rhomboid family intramembrane serine protease [Amedibacillus sp. YH-ame10]